MLSLIHNDFYSETLGAEISAIFLKLKSILWKLVQSKATKGEKKKAHEENKCCTGRAL